MATEGNMAKVRDAFIGETAELPLREQQRYPYKGWYAVIVRSGREQDAADGFRRENVLAYWPNYERQLPTGMHAGARRHRVVFASIIPGMIFCPTADLDLFWNAIQRIAYVMNILRKDGGQPATLSNADIESIRQIEADENEPPKVTPVHTFKMGQKVRFADHLSITWPPGKIAKLAKDGRISVEVYLMGRMVPITVLPHQIEAISQGPR